MARQTATLALLVCALVVAGQVRAASYDDWTDGNWVADTTDTWSEGIGDYPASDDTALIDSAKVTVAAAADLDPELVSITVGGSGELYFNSTVTTSATTTLYLTGGGAVNKSRYQAVNWAGPVVVTGGVTTMYTGRDQAWTISGAVSSTTSNCTIAREVGDHYNSTILTGDNSGFSGIWDVRDGGLKPRNNQALGTGTVTVGDPGASSAKLVFRGAETWTGIAGPQACVFTENGWLDFDYTSPGADIDFTNDTLFIFDGGGTADKAGTLRDPVLVKDGGMIIHPWTANHDFRCNISSESSNAKITVEANTARFYGENSGYTGDIEVNGGTLHLYHPLAVGAVGTLTVTNGTLFCGVVPSGTVAQPYVYIGAGGTFGGDHGADTDWDLTLDGGQFYEKYAAMTHTGGIILGPNGGTINSGYGALTFTGTISGTGKLTCNLGGGHGGDQIFVNPNNSWSGGTDITNCRADVLQVKNDGAMGSGTITVLDSGRLETSPAGGTGSAVITNLPVVVQAGGLLELNSTETAANVTLQKGGSFRVLGGLTELDYDNNFHAQAGAVFYETMQGTGTYDGLPTVSQIAPDALGQYIYLGGLTNFAATDYTVGTGTAARGLAPLFGNCNLNATTTIHEATPGGGFDLFAGGAGLSFSANIMYLKGATVDGTGPVTLRGGGNFILNAAPALSGTLTIDCRGEGLIQFPTAGGLSKNQTLNVHSGLMYMGFRATTSLDALGESNDPADFATVNIKSGAGMDATKGVINRGNIHVESGGWVGTRLDSVSGGANWDFQRGSGLAIWDAVSSATVVASGNVNFYFPYYDKKIGAAGTVDMVLSDDTRITSDYNRGPTADSGDITLAGGSTEGLLTAKDGTTLYVRNEVNIPAGTLVIGAAGTFRVFRGYDWTPYDWRDITQAGYVNLENTANSIDKIRIDAGTLRINNATGAPLGGADIHIAAGATLDYYRTATTLTDYNISGFGQITKNQNYVLTLAGGSLNPGSNPTAGTLAVNSYYLDFAVGSGSAQVIIDVASDGGGSAPVAGTGGDYDQLDVNTNVRYLPNAALTVNLPVPSKTLNPDNLVGDTLTVMTCSDNLTGLVTGVDGFSTALINTVDDAKNHWSGTVNYENGKVTVTDLTWTAHKGDADLSDEVDVLDIVKLANNFQREDAGVNWTTADLDLSGKVDVLDLVIIANNFGWKVTGGGGGAPVPEPACLVILALGGIALMRRRRR